MEGPLKINDVWQIDSASFSNDYELLENTKAWFSLLHIPTECDYSFEINLLDGVAGKAAIKINARGSRSKKLAKELEELLSTDHFGTIRCICFMLQQTYSFDSMKTLLKKAAWWDAVHGGHKRFTPTLPEYNEAFDRFDMDLHTPLDKWVFYNPDAHDKSEMLNLIEWTLNTYAAPLFRANTQHRSNNCSQVPAHSFNHFTL